MEGLIYIRREICISKSLGLAFTVSTLSFFIFEGNFPSTSPQGAYIWRDDLTEGLLCYRFGGLYLEGLIHGGAYFRNFTVFLFPMHIGG